MTSKNKNWCNKYYKLYTKIHIIELLQMDN